MKKDEFILGQVQELMCELWQVKYIDQPSNAVERNIFEADMKKMWDDIEEALEAMVEIGEVNDSLAEMEDDICKLEVDCDGLQERILQLEEKNTELATQNYDLACEKKKLWDKLQEISKVVNDTWS